jgi:hypothetical protein
MIGLPFSAAKLAGMGDQHRQILLEDRRDCNERQILLRELDGAPAAQVEVKPAGHQQLHVVDQRSAFLDRHVQAMLRIDAGRERLVIAAVFRLRLPVQTEDNLVRGARWGRAEQRNQEHGKSSNLTSHGWGPVLFVGCRVSRPAAGRR